MIINLKKPKLSIWTGKYPSKKSSLLPKFSTFDGGCYWKFGIIWMNYLLEVSGSKKIKTL
jgi:hypothetical protein